MDRDEELLLAVLNSAPVVDGRPTDDLGDAAGRELARRWGGVGTEDELERLRRARDALTGDARGAHGVRDQVRELRDGRGRTRAHDGLERVAGAAQPLELVLGADSAPPPGELATGRVAEV
ncbi:hypothetical protein C5C82_14685, partial [Rathayibacter sp. AY1D5]